MHQAHEPEWSGGVADTRGGVAAVRKVLLPYINGGHTAALREGGGGWGKKPRT